MIVYSFFFMKVRRRIFPNGLPDMIMQIRKYRIEHNGYAHDQTAEHTDRHNRQHRIQIEKPASFPTPIATFERKHTPRTNEQSGKHQRQYQDVVTAQYLSAPRLMQAERRPKHRVGRRRQARKTLSLRGVNIEFGQTVGRTQRHEKSRECQTVPEQRLRAHHRKRHKGRQNAETDHIGQRIELYPQRPRNAQHPRRHAVEYVEHRRRKHQYARRARPSRKQQPYPHTPAKQVAQGKQIGNKRPDTYFHDCQ